METKTLTVELPEDLYHQLIETVTKPGGRWRSQRKEETENRAIESAVAAALMLFLQGLDGETELPEFREYAGRKYPELNEDLVTMIEDLIKRHKQVVALKPRTIHVTPKLAQEIGRREIEKKYPQFFDD